MVLIHEITPSVIAVMMSRVKDASAMSAAVSTSSIIRATAATAATSRQLSLASAAIFRVRGLLISLLNLLRALVVKVSLFMLISPLYKHVGVLVSPANPTGNRVSDFR